MRPRPDTVAAFAATQAAWRFYNNPAVTLPDLATPLVEAARQGIPGLCRDYALVVHDWSQLHYNGHSSKKDRIVLTNPRDSGYELSAALVIGDRDGSPLAPAALQLRAADGIHSTLSTRVCPPITNKLDRLGPVMDFIGELDWEVPVVHIADREADSVDHFRQWDAAGRLFLVRADDVRVVRHEGTECLLSAVADRLKRRGDFRQARRVAYHGGRVRQYIAQTTVTLERPAKRHGERPGSRREIAGPPLTLRLVVSEIRDDRGRVEARWLLLSNVPAKVRAARIALWYYWRWRVESYFKLLKSAGHHLEQWQQKTAAATARRLAVTAMAVVAVWRLSADKTTGAAELRRLLVRLSGRQMRRDRPATWPALLAGLWVLLSMLEILEHYDLDKLRRLAETALTFPSSIGALV